MKNDEIGVTVGTTVLQAAGYSISGRERLAGKDTAADIPLVIAIPGGTYTSTYFDVPGYSLLDHAAVSGIPVIAIDRPGMATARHFRLQNQRLPAMRSDSMMRLGRSGRGLATARLGSSSSGTRLAVPLPSKLRPAGQHGRCWG